ncbi:hypothetical protein AB0A77_32615 [Streptomyces varsoviensis]|uniref:hypothetical protein n=1 Tax=Streptomyces varsoviensis TaxID=67373 RepID=UPI0033F68542
MPPEAALLESRAMRDSVMGHVEVLDKVGALRLLPDGIHITTEDVAAFFDIHREAVKKVVQRHRDELEENGLRVIRGDDLRLFKMDNLSTFNEGPSESYPQLRSNLSLFTRRAVLNVAMLLRDSAVAQRVRTYLLDTEESHRTGGQQEPPPGYASLDRRVTALETCMAGVGTALQELGPVIGRISARLDRIDQRLDGIDDRLDGIDNRLDDFDRRLHATNRVVCAMSERLAALTPPPRRRRHR